jgi:selenide,water dikinase
VHPKKYWANVGAKPGDVLILTKPIGSGVIFNAKLKKLVSDAAFAHCIATVTTLNRSAAEVLSAFEVHAATDVTGFGLAGHGLEMTSNADICLAIDLSAVPVMPEAVEMYAKGVTTGVNKHNRASVGDRVQFEASAPVARHEILFDPQTSGGLLAAVPAEQADQILTELHRVGLTDAATIGRVETANRKIRLRIH